MSNYTNAITAINTSNLSPSTRANALALLDMVHPDNGHACLRWEDLTMAFGLTSIGRARAHLGAMQAIGLIHYSTNGKVFINFYDWEIDHARANVARGRADSDHPRAESEPGKPLPTSPVARPRAKNDHGRAESDHSVTRALSQSVSQSNDPDPDHGLTNEQSAPPEPENRRPPPPAEVTRSEELLTDAEVGLDPATAHAFAAKHRFEWLFRQVLTWRRQLEVGKVDGPGALIHRIERHYGCSLTKADKQTELYHRYMGAEADENTEAARRKKYIPPELASVIEG